MNTIEPDHLKSSQHAYLPGYLKALTIQVRKIMAYRMELLNSLFMQTTVTIIMSIILWNGVLKGSATQYTQSKFIFYFFIAQLVNRILIGEGIGFISREIYQGTLNKYLIYPTNLIHIRLFQYFGTSIVYYFQLVFGLTLFYVFFSPLPPAWSQILIAHFSIFFATILYFFLSLFIEHFAFYVDHVWSLRILQRHSIEFLGGLFIPLDFFPTWAQEILWLTPFPHLIYVPVKLLSPDPVSINLSEHFLVVICWSVALGALAKFSWKSGRKAYTGVGM